MLSRNTPKCQGSHHPSARLSASRVTLSAADGVRPRCVADFLHHDRRRGRSAYRANKIAHDADVTARLWQLSADLVGMTPARL